jgi:hypothetical protein
MMADIFDGPPQFTDLTVAGIFSVGQTGTNRTSSRIILVEP